MNIGGVNVKSVIDSKYPSLTYEIFRIADNSSSIAGYDDWPALNNEIKAEFGQGYLAIKGFLDGDKPLQMYSQFDPKNYAEEQVWRYIDYSNSFTYMINGTSTRCFDLYSIPKHTKNQINDLFLKVKGRPMSMENNKKELEDLYDWAVENIFTKHIYLTQINSKISLKSYKSRFVNMVVYVITLILSLVFMIIGRSDHLMDFGVLAIVSLFITNTIDLLIGTWRSVNNELNVTEIYKV